MRELTTKVRLAINFSLYVFLFFLFISGIFYLLLRLTLINELKRNLREETVEVSTNHLNISQEIFEIIPDPAGNLLTEELAKHGLSAIFFDQNLSFIDGYSLFNFFDKKDTASVEKIAASTRQVKDSLKEKEEILNWGGQTLYVHSAPIVRGGTFYGVTLLARPMDNLISVLQSTIIILASLTLFAFVGSYVLGYLLVSKSLGPIRRLAAATDKIDLNQLDIRLNARGNPEDETVILIKKFNEMVTRIKTLSAMQKDFISHVSHELRTPLTRAISSLELLDRRRKDFNSRLRQTKEDLFQINSLLDNLLMLSRLRKDSTTTADNIEVKSAVEEIVKDYAKPSQAKKMAFAVKIPRRMVLYFPQEYFRVVLSNLVSNAIKYGRAGSPILISAKVQKHRNLLFINNKGSTLGKNETRKIFDKFYRGKNTQSREGEGLGLSIVKQICDLYGVKIKVESDKKAGITFSLIFRR
jgi:signal transduction histidine kinase